MHSPHTAECKHLGRDERGAMMVMGIFVCTFLVGAMWTIAGLGEAVVMRDRMQEISDSTAFAAATIDARGMNILVLYNLIMAAILSIRVMLNALIAAAIVVSIFFFGLGVGFAASLFLSFLAPPAFAVAAAAAAVAVGIANIRDNGNPSVDQQINDDLTALEDGAGGVADATPALASGAGGIPGLYGATLSTAPQPQAATGAGANVAQSLPVGPGGQDTLCSKAWQASSDELGYVLNQSKASRFLTSIAEDIFGLILDAGRLFGQNEDSKWCELVNAGTGTGNPAAAQNSLANNSCGDPQGQAVLQSRTDPNHTPDTSCQSMSSDQDLVNQLAADGGPDYQNALQKLTDDTTACQNGQQSCADGADAGTQPPPSGSPPAQAAGQTAPKIPPGTQEPYISADSYSNGTPLAQTFSRLSLSPAAAARLTSFAPQFVQIASGGAVKTVTQPTNFGDSYSQAEYFYQCAGAWKAPNLCDDANNAMWNYDWHARLRLFNASAIGLEQAQEASLCSPGPASTSSGGGRVIPNVKKKARRSAGGGSGCNPDPGPPLILTAAQTASNEVNDALKGTTGATQSQSNLKTHVAAVMGSTGVLVVH
jgi:hypothetical protein